MRLADATDLDLVKNGLASVECIEREGPVMGALTCFGIGHAWSEEVQELPEEEPFNVCARCGTVRRAGAGDISGEG